MTARATQAQIDRQLDLLQQVIERHPDGIAQPEIAELYERAAGAALDERTLQRRLKRLADAGRVRPEGETRARRYFPIVERESDREEFTGEPEAPDDDAFAGIVLSRAAAEALARIRGPITARTPVGYDEAFLGGYRPGKDWYLAADLRGRLREIGMTPDPNRPAGTFARDIFERLLIDLAWASSRLEGNTYDRLDTRNLLELGIHAEGKDAADAQMILNHKKAIEMLVEHAEDLDWNRYTFLNLHAALSENLLSDSRDEGRLRTRMVNITGTTYTPLAIPQKLEELFDLMLEKARAIPDPFEQAFFAMVHVPYLQPFTDVNKRTSRLGANLPLVKANLCPLSFVDVPERAYVESVLAIYEARRIEPLRDLFMWAYERSADQFRVTREALGQPDPLRLRYREELRDVLREVVLDLQPPQRALLRGRAEAHGVPSGDLDPFTDAALGLLVDLHEGALYRYGLSPGDLTRWRGALPRKPSTSEPWTLGGSGGDSGGQLRSARRR